MIMPINITIGNRLPIQVTLSSIDPNKISISKYKTHLSVNETPDDIRTNFTCPSGYVAGTLLVYRSQSNLIRGIDYTETSPITGGFQLMDAPDADENIRVSYISI